MIKKYKEGLIKGLRNSQKPLLRESFDTLNKKGASGVDAETWIDYHKQRETRIPQLLRAFKSGNYQAPNMRRVYIPKGD